MGKRLLSIVALACLGWQAARGAPASAQEMASASAGASTRQAAPAVPSAPAAPADGASAAAPANVATTAAVTAAVTAAAPATVVVSGRRPGPGVWKVSRGAHVMWVFGTYAPLPDKMEWDSGRIERLVARSQEVLKPPVAKAHIDFLRGLLALPGLIGIKKNPDGEVLQDVLPLDVYAHWTQLKARYLGDDDGIEHDRPIFAGEALMRAGLKQNGLTLDGGVLATIERIAKKNKVKLSDSGIDVMLDDPRQLVKDFKTSHVDDIVCLTQTLDTLDHDLETMRIHANAWANGNVAEIRTLDFAQRQDTCMDAVLNSAFANDSTALRQMRDGLRSAWLRTAEKSLAANPSTFAVLEMRDLAGPHGYLAALQAKGYSVESPR